MWLKNKFLAGGCQELKYQHIKYRYKSNSYELRPSIFEDFLMPDGKDMSREID